MLAIGVSVVCFLVVGSLTLDGCHQGRRRELVRSIPAIGLLRYALSRDYVRGVSRWLNVCLTCVRVDYSPARDGGHGSLRLAPYGW